MPKLPDASNKSGMPIAFYGPISKPIQCKSRVFLPKPAEGYQSTKCLKEFDVDQMRRVKLFREHLFRVPHAERRLDKDFESQRCV